MKKSARTSAPESTRWQHVERLTDAVHRLADEVRVVRDVLSEIREDLSWVTRNGIPGHPTVHTQLLRMAADPLATDANERLEFRRFSSEGTAYPELASDVLDELVSEIVEAVTVVGQEQVNLLLTALDDARAKLLAAIKSPIAQSKADMPTIASRPQPSQPALKASPEPSEPGHLF